MKLIPAIDLKDGKCVRLLKGDFGMVTEYSSDPSSVGSRFSDLAVEDMHIVDLDGARFGAQHNREIVTEIASRSGLSIQLGGGIRSLEDVAQWLLAGVRRCVVGSVAILEPDTVKQWLKKFGADAIVLALDVNLNHDGVPMLATHGWTKESGVSLWSCVDGYVESGVRHVLCTDIGRDGAMAGPNLDLYRSFLQRYPNIQLQASGGVRNIADLEELRACGVPAAISGRALLDGVISSEEVASFRQSA